MPEKSARLFTPPAVLPRLVSTLATIAALQLAAMAQTETPGSVSGGPAYTLRKHAALLKVAVVDGLNLRYDPFANADLSELTGKPGAAPKPKDQPAGPTAGEVGGKPPTENAPTYVPVGPVKVAAIDNKGAVKNRPRKPVIIDTPNPILVKSIRTYHWNSGRGRRPGSIAIRGSDGRTFGPWPAKGLRGSGGVRNAYWYVQPEIVLPPGKYQLIDSNPATWATNVAAGGKGFVVMKYQEARATPTPMGTRPATQEQATQPTDGKRYTNPMIGEFRLDWCLKNQRNCGKPAADEFCKLWNLKEAVSFKKAEGVGRLGPTREILDGAFCEKPSCAGFSEIVCR